MKVNEVIGRTQNLTGIKPTELQRNERIQALIAQLAASDAKRPYTDEEKAAALQQYIQLLADADAEQKQIEDNQKRASLAHTKKP